MTLLTLIRRSLRFHWRAHLGVALGAAVGSASLIGALVVGDSVRESLRERALQRLGRINFALASGDRFCRVQLGHEMGAAVPDDGITAGALLLLGSAASADGQHRANRVQVLGVENGFWRLANQQPAFAEIPNDSIVLNQALAEQLGTKPGDTVVLRVPKASAFSKDAPLAPQSEATIGIRAKVHAVVSDDGLGRFSLRATHIPPFNAFIRLDQLAGKVGATNRINQMLVSWSAADQPGGEEKRSPALSERLQQLLEASFQLPDAEADLRELPVSGVAELRSRRIFLDPPIVRAALAADTNAQPILTYLANLLRAATNAAPYSMVAAAGPPWTPPDMRDDEIIVGQWLAEDLQVKPGDRVELSYFLPESAANLIEATNQFRVRAIVPMEMPWADRTLMPDFPGIEKAESTRDWDAGFPLVHKIRQTDEDYWKERRGTPKAFVTLAAGQKMWANRFGELTAIRFPIPTRTTAEEYRTAIGNKILGNLKPEEIGLHFEPVRQQALQAAGQSQDFGQLFLGFSFFLIAAALLLVALLFQLGLEQRATEIGALLALGFPPKQVRMLWLGEGAVLSLLGGILGALGGIAYARAMLHGLTTIWRDAVGATLLDFHMTGQTLAMGLCSGVLISLATIWLTLRKFVRRAPRELLAGEVECGEVLPADSGQAAKRQNTGKSKHSKTGWLALLLAVALGGWVVAKGDTANAGAFFGAGALLLLAGLSFVHAWLARLQAGRFGPNPPPTGLQGPGRHALTLGSLGLRGCARRRKRSVATMAMLACGSFLIVSIGVFRLDANLDATNRSSGTGGFALIGETTMPVTQDLNSKSGRDFFALNENDLAGVNFVSFRVREGDEASCLNLNRAQRPRLLGVKPEILEGRFAFAKGAGWAELKSDTEPSRLASAATNQIEIPAIGDANSIQWALGRKVGDTIDFVDERGQAFKLRLAGAVANSILQGSLIIDEAEFVKRFPSESGYRMFLIDAPSNAISQVSAALSRAIQDAGLELTPAPQRLAQFNAVQNTYLRTFQILGGLGLLLGSFGLGVVVLRNVLERRGELGLLLALGFRARSVQRLVLTEHAALLGLGLALGVAAATVAVLPALLSPGERLPYASLALTLGAVLANGALWTWLATRFALRGNLLEALRND